MKYWILNLLHWVVWQKALQMQIQKSTKYHWVTCQNPHISFDYHPCYFWMKFGNGRCLLKWKSTLDLVEINIDLTWPKNSNSFLFQNKIKWSIDQRTRTVSIKSKLRDIIEIFLSKCLNHIYHHQKYWKLFEI